MPFEIGQVVSDYEILDILGKGGMGRVYRVRNAISGRIEAMKVLLADFVGEAEVAERFGSEIRTLARLDHPNIAKLLTAFRVENEIVMLMEFVEGFTLTDRARQGPIPWPELQSYVSQTLAALDYAHQSGVIHRDIKPSNVMVTGQGIVKLMDFGIAKSSNDNLQTRAGITMGSVSYMSPEQVRGNPVDARSDVYSMGIVLYELAAGRRPFESESTWAVLEAQMNQMPTPPADVNPTVPQALNDIIMRALQKDPAERFQSADEFRLFVESVGGAPVSKPATTFSPTRLNQGSMIQAASDFRTLRADTPPPAPDSVVPPPKGRSQNWLIIGSAVLALLLAAAVVYVWLNKKPKNPIAAQTTAPPAATEAVPVTPANLPPQLHFASGDMVLIPGGQAHLGDKRTPTPVSSFYIDKTEVSLGAYRQFCKEKSVDPPQGSAGMPADMPVTNVTYYEASQFATWAGKRLPKANEWELAARGLDGLRFPWGNTFVPGLANLKAGGVGHLLPVNSDPQGASPAGALNMVGNASEVVDTTCDAPVGMQFEEYRSKEFKDLVPPLSPREPFYQVRGGSYRYSIKPSDLPALVWDNTPFPARARQPDVGFRCARDASH